MRDSTDYHNWDVTYVKPNIVGTLKECPETYEDLRVYKLDVNLKNERSTATFWEFTFNLARGYFEKLDRRIFIHEYGHQLGLGDSYTEEGYQQPIGQDPGMMNNLYVMQGLSADDIAGLRHVWDRIQGISNSQCPRGYITGDVKENRNNFVFCIKDPNSNPKPISAPVPIMSMSNMYEDRHGSKKCLTASKKTLLLGQCDQSRWEVSPKSHDTFKIKEKNTRKCLAVSSHQKIKLTRCKNVKKQLWTQGKVSQNYFQLESVFHHSLCINYGHIGGVLALEPCAHYQGFYWKLLSPLPPII